MKTAIVSGARRGIGLAIAKKLIENDYYVYILATSPPKGNENLPEKNSTYIVCDISDKKQRETMFDEVLKKAHKIDLLVNNAGVAPKKREDLLSMKEESLRRVVEINLFSTFFMCQEAANIMIEHKKTSLDYTPRIINIGSISAYTASTSRGEYCISKAGVSMVTSLFADRLGQYEIPVFEIRPGIIKTDMTKLVEDKYIELIDGGLTPIKRMGLPQDVADCCYAAASGLLDFATGQVINADGGFHIRRL